MACHASMKKQIRIPLRSFWTLGLVMPLLLGLLSACSVPRLNVSADAVLYIPEVVQGNFVSREQKQFLKPGMSRLQVKEVLGTPLVSSVFHEDRWDYVFTIRRQGVPPQNFSLSVWFKGDLLDQVTGDDLPSETEFVTKLVVERPSLKVPVLEAKDEDLRKFPAPVRKAEPTAAPAAPLPSSYPPLEPASR
jgi:outer membrane protein assembly factor BamE